MKRIMHETAMKDTQTPTSKKQSLRSWRTFRRKVAQALSFLLFGLAMGMIQGCGEGGGSVGDATLTPVAVNSASLSWSPPTTTLDGSPLTNLAGYQIYYGQTTPVTIENSQSALVNDSNQTSYVVSDLGPGTYYFTVTALDSNGNESAMSNEGSKTVL